MALNVPRLTLVNGVLYDGDGVRYCSRCGKRPAVVTPSRAQSYCAVCHADDRRKRRAGKTEMLLTADERALVLEFRAERRLADFDRGRQPAGKHHATA